MAHPASPGSPGRRTQTEYGPPHLLAVVALFLWLLSCSSSSQGPEGRKTRHLPRGGLFACALVSESERVAVGDMGRIFFSADGGRNWQGVPSGTRAALVSVCFPDPVHGWIAGQGGIVLHSSDGGRTWTRQETGVDAYLLDLDFLDPRRGVAVGADSTILLTSDGGLTWRKSPIELRSALGETINLFSVVMPRDSRICITADRGRIFLSEDGGASWRNVPSPLYDEGLMEGRSLYDMAEDEGVLYAVGVDGVFAVSRDLGATWTVGETGSTGPDLYAVDMVHGKGMAVGSGGHVIRTLDAGAKWEKVPVPPEIERNWLAGVDLRETTGGGGLEGLAVGLEGTVGVLREGGWLWSSRLPGTKEECR